YFALADVLRKFHYLKLSLVVLLALIGVKMLLKDVLHAVPGLTYYTLGAIVLVLTAGIITSLVRARRLSAEAEPQATSGAAGETPSPVGRAAYRPAHAAGERADESR